MPGWERGDDYVDLLVSFARARCESRAALAYTQSHAAFEADVVAIGTGAAGEYPSVTRGKIALLAPDTALAAREFSRIAGEKGIRGILFINREGGGHLTSAPPKCMRNSFCP